MPLATLLPEKVRYIVVHCSASPPSVYVDAKVIDRWHKERGFLKLGYHYVIKRDGAIEAGRKLSEVGAHVEGYNSVSVGVCLVGGVNEARVPVDNFASLQKDSLRWLLEQLSVMFPTAVVQGHRDFPNVRKECPSFNCRKWWASVNQ